MVQTRDRQTRDGQTTAKTRLWNELEKKVFAITGSGITGWLHA